MNTQTAIAIVIAIILSIIVSMFIILILSAMARAQVVIEGHWVCIFIHQDILKKVDLNHVDISKHIGLLQNMTLGRNVQECALMVSTGFPIISNGSAPK